MQRIGAGCDPGQLEVALLVRVGGARDPVATQCHGGARQHQVGLVDNAAADASGLRRPGRFPDEGGSKSGRPATRRRRRKRWRSPRWSWLREHGRARLIVALDKQVEAGTQLDHDPILQYKELVCHTIERDGAANVAGRNLDDPGDDPQRTADALKPTRDHPCHAEIAGHTPSLGIVQQTQPVIVWPVDQRCADDRRHPKPAEIDRDGFGDTRANPLVGEIAGDIRERQDRNAGGGERNSTRMTVPCRGHRLRPDRDRHHGDRQIHGQDQRNQRDNN